MKFWLVLSALLGLILLALATGTAAQAGGGGPTIRLPMVFSPNARLEVDETLAVEPQLVWNTPSGRFVIGSACPRTAGLVAAFIGGDPDNWDYLPAENGWRFRSSFQRSLEVQFGRLVIPGGVIRASSDDNQVSVRAATWYCIASRFTPPAPVPTTGVLPLPRIFGPAAFVPQNSEDMARLVGGADWAWRYLGGNVWKYEGPTARFIVPNGAIADVPLGRVGAGIFIETSVMTLYNCTLPGFSCN